MSKKYILALDQGTSSSRSVLFDQDQNVIGVEQEEFKQFYPKAGWVEHNPHEIWESQYLTTKTLITRLKINPEDIAAIGITNQRETAVVWDKRTGEPICNAIVWQDKRTSELCGKLIRFGYKEYVKENTGLVIDSYFSGTKINWILENVDGAREKAERGELLFGTVDSWLIWKLSGGKLHLTDYSNASRTMIYNIKELQWDEKMLTLLKIPESMLPEVKDSSEIYGTTAKELFGKEIPIAGIAGDQQAALFGQQCYTAGEAKNTYGTGCFMLMNTADTPVSSESGLLTTIAWGLNGKITYALEGSVFIAGAALKWLRDGLKIIDSAGDTEAMVNKTDSNEGVYFVPAFAGLGAPYWNSNARGIITGLTQGVNENHIVRATLEALAYQTKDILDAMSKDSGIELKELRVDGGASVNNFLMQFQSNILQCNVIRPENVETTATGAAMLAGLAVGLWKQEDIHESSSPDRIFECKASSDDAERLYSGWKKAVKQCMAGE